ncbi:MAG: HD domain-containing protein [Butyrivibrio sp.]|nr:HD domain-containing protein [Butyrivibrio sp.]
MKNKYLGLFGQLDKETATHSVRVAEICKYLAPVIGIDEDLAYTIGYVHDIGKMYIPSRIIKKSEALTELERDIVDMHSFYGYRLLKELGDPKEIYLPVLYHHGFDKPKLYFKEGCGMLSKELAALISMVHSADIFDAMQSKRVYHEPFSIEETLAELANDPLCTEDIYNALSGCLLYRKVVSF